MTVMIGIPDGGGHTQSGIIPALNACGVAEYEMRIAHGGTACSNYNSMLCMAVNAGCSHFLMLHNDVVPLTRGWAARMLAIMAEGSWAALSVVLPIKADGGETSTAIQWDYGLRKTIARLSRKECDQYPETFGLSDVLQVSPHYKATALLINNGLLLIDLAQADPRKGFLFRGDEWIAAMTDGKIQADFLPEDWQYSLQLHENGLRYAATTAIEAMHYGEKGWKN